MPLATEDGRSNGGAAGPSRTRTRRTKRTTRAVVGMALAAAMVAGLAAVPGGSGGPAPVGALDPAPPDAMWVGAVYEDLFERAPTPAQLQHRVGQLQAGRSRRAVADELVASREHAGVLVDRLYRRILGRAADPSSRTYWIDRLIAGDRPTTVASFLYGSPEMFTRAGATAEGYVAFLYRDVLGREPDAAGAAYWAARIESGENRTRLARSWLLTSEATGLRAVLVFIDLLGRPPSPSEQADWTGRLQRLDDRRVTAALVSTAEHHARAQDPAALTYLTRKDDAHGGSANGDPSISADGRIVAFSSRATHPIAGGDWKDLSDIWVFDRRTGRMRAITTGNASSGVPQVSADGTTVVFESLASNLVSGDTGSRYDVFRAPTAGGPIERIAAGNGDSRSPRTNADGSVVTFLSAATDLGPTDTNGAEPDVYVRTDAGAGPPLVERVAGVVDAAAPDVSADGSTLVFEGKDLDVSDEPQAHLARLPLGASPEPVRLSETRGRTPTVSADGSRAAYVEDTLDGGWRPAIQLLTVGPTGVTARQPVPAGEQPERPRVSDDGSAVLVGTLLKLRPFIAWADTLAFADGTPPPHQVRGHYGDLTADGRTLVTNTVLYSPANEIALYEAG